MKSSERWTASIAKRSTKAIVHSFSVADFKNARSMWEATDGFFQSSASSCFQSVGASAEETEGEVGSGGTGGRRVGGVRDAGGVTAGAAAERGGAEIEGATGREGDGALGSFDSNASKRRINSPASTNGWVSRRA